MGGSYGDDLMWDGLACPPLEDYAFNFFDTSTSTLEDSLFEDDDLLDDPLLEIEEHEDMITNICFNDDYKLDKMVAACMDNPPTPPSLLLDDFPHLPAMSDPNSWRKINTKANVGTHPYGKCKVLKILARVLPLEKHSKTSFYCQIEQPKDNVRFDHTYHVVPVDKKRKVDYDDLRTEGLVSMNSIQGRRGAKVNYQPRCGNHGKGKDLNTIIQAMDLNEEQIKTIFGETDKVVENQDKKKRKIMDFNDTQPMMRKDKTVLDQRLENKRIVDYESRFEASRQMLHKAYKQAGEAKQQRHIQVIDFQKPEIQQPGSKGKTKGKPSLRKKLMAMETRKSNKKFTPYKMLSSCN